MPRPKDSDQRCSNCYFWVRGEDSSTIKDAGRCHSHPPVYVDGINGGPRYKFPIIDQDQWCGEWRPGADE